MNKKILLVGGAGYIGTVLTDYFLKKGYKIKCLDALIYPKQEVPNKFLKNKNYEFIHGDIRDLISINKSLKEVDNIVILAGLVGDPITKKYPKQSEDINYFGIKNFIDNCSDKNIHKLIFVSTCSNYGIINNNQKADENFNLKPLSSYAKHKVEIEKYILSLKNKVSYSPTILRFATAFGLSPRMRFDLTVNHFTKELAEEKILNIYDADTWRPYCHVNDFARLIEIVLNNEDNKTDFEIFNAGSDKNNYTKKNILDEIVKILPKSNITYNDEGVDKRNYRVDFSKVKKILNFEAQYTVPDGIKEIYKAINSNSFSKNINHFGNFEIKL